MVERGEAPLSERRGASNVGTKLFLAWKGVLQVSADRLPGAPNRTAQLTLG